MCSSLSDEDEAFLVEEDNNIFSEVEHGHSPTLKIFLISSLVSGSMASLQLGAASLINESWVFFGSSLKLRIGFRNKRFRRVAERWRFRVPQMSCNEQRTKHELALSAKRTESLRYILKQYGVSVETVEKNKTSSEGKHEDVPSSFIDDSKMKSTEESPDLRRQEKYSETVSTAENRRSGETHYKLTHLNTGFLFTSLLPVLGFCIVCIFGMLHRIISRNLKNSRGRKTSQGHDHSSKITRWRTVLSDWNEPFSSDEHDLSPENRVGSANQEAAEAYNRVEREYQRFLSECGVIES